MRILKEKLAGGGEGGGSKIHDCFYECRTQVYSMVTKKYCFNVVFFAGFLRLSVWRSFSRARSRGVQGNLDGEGRILGGVFVVGPGEQGILLDHKEKEFGDKVDLKDVMDAVQKI